MAEDAAQTADSDQESVLASQELRVLRIPAGDHGGDEPVRRYTGASIVQVVRCIFYRGNIFLFLSQFYCSPPFLAVNSWVRP